MIKCRVCGSEIKGQMCGRCGFSNVAALDKDSFDRLKKASDEKRAKIIKNITDISLQTYEYKYNGGKKLERSDRLVKIADGEECFGAIKWTDQSFALGKTFPDTIELKYKTGGADQSVELRIRQKPERGNFKIGVIISEDLGISAVIGAPNGYVESKKEQMRLI